MADSEGSIVVNDEAVRARIATLHSLCHDLLRERPLEAGVDPLFDVCAEGEARRIFERVFGPRLTVVNGGKV